MQIGWSLWRFDCQRPTKSELRKRFVIIRTTDRFIATDYQRHEQMSFHTLVAARAWVGIRAGETVVRH